MIKELLNKLKDLKIFLEVKNGKIKVNAPKGILTSELIASIKKNKSQLIKLLSSKSIVQKTLKKKDYDLTPTQEFMWFTHKHLGGDTAYNISSIYKFKGNLNTEYLEQSIHKSIERHESLRTIIKEDKTGKPRQLILPIEKIKFKIQKNDLSNTTKESIHNYIKHDYLKPFKLDTDILIRVSVIKTDPNEHLFLLTLHHIISDGWSLEVLAKEIMSYYNTSINDGTTTIFPDLTVQYRDYSEMLSEKIKGVFYDETIRFWKKQLAGELPILEIPTYDVRPKIKTYNGHTIMSSFSQEFSILLSSFSKSQKLTIFTTLLGSINGLLSRYTNQTDIILGTTVAGRDYSNTTNQIGLYSNALAIRTRFDSSISFKNLINTQNEILLKTFEHKELPFSKVIENLKLKKQTNRSPLFDVMVILQNQNTARINNQLGIEGLEIEPYTEISRKVSQYDITFSFIQLTDKLQLSVEYNTDLFKNKFIKRFIKHLKNFILSGINSPDISINKLSYLTQKEQQELIYGFNDTKVDYPKDKTIIDLLKISCNSENLGLVFEESNYTYKQIEETTNQLANYLIKVHKVKKGDFVCIELPRSQWMILTLIAVLKIGAVYVPVDCKLPEERKKFIFKDSNSKLTINETFVTDFLNKKNKKNSGIDIKLSNTDLAYIIYTSGSTGKPKGVKISHRSLFDYVTTFNSYFSINKDDVCLQQSSISFDTSIEEIFPILTKGGILIVQKDIKDFNNILKTCEQYSITLLSTNPYLLQFLNQNYQNYNLTFKTIISGGDTLKPEFVNNLVSKFNVYNTYGPTESTVCATFFKIERNQVDTLPIGKPITNRQVYILSETNQLQPKGVIGELCISGEGLSRGYLNRPELTKEKFIPHPFKEGERLYKTGDLVRWLPDGNLEFIGRKDTQVKIRGYRIELGEIEQVISTYQDVIQVVAEVKAIDEQKSLVAYLVSETEIDKQKLRNFLTKELPEYMVPSYFVTIDNIPLTPNGKIDRKSLPEVDSDSVIRQEYVAPKTKIEKQLVAIWQEVLGVKKIGITDNFFELGGHSLKITQLINKIEKELQLSFKVKDIFLFPTIEYVQNKLVEQKHNTIPKITKSKDYPLTSQQYYLWILCQQKGASRAYNIPLLTKLKGGINMEYLHKSVIHLINRHAVLRTVFVVDGKKIRQKIIDLNNFKNFYSYFEIGKEEPINELLFKHVNQTFNLNKGPLLKVNLYKVNNYEHILLINIHHIICDGWSLSIMIKDLMIYYNSLINKTPEVLSELSFQYTDYAVWYNQLNIKKEKFFWMKKFKFPPEPINFNDSQKKLNLFNGNKESFVFSSSLNENMVEFCNRNNITKFMLLLAASTILLYKYSEKTDIVFTTGVSNRNHEVFNNQVGFYVNTIPLRLNFSQELSITEFLEFIKNIVINSLDNQRYSIGNLLNDLHKKNIIVDTSLFNIGFTYQDFFSRINKKFEKLDVELIDFNYTSSKFDISFLFLEELDQLSFRIEYNTNVLNKYTILQFGNSLMTIVNDICNDKYDKEIMNINLLNDLDDDYIYQLINN